MSMKEGQIRIAIAERSTVVRCGMAALLNKIDDFQVQIIEIASPLLLQETLIIQKPDILIVNPQFENNGEQVELPKQMRTVALLTSIISQNDIAKYDRTFSIYDDEETLLSILQALCHSKNNSEDQDELSQREKEIVIGVVKGLVNKEIADNLCISVNTVITHRRNIARKLHIHSPAGLTIYAIVNKLVDITDI
jgi:two-component system, NarL family, response regulator NreC